MRAYKSLYLHCGPSTKVNRVVGNRKLKNFPLQFQNSISHKNL